MRSPLDGASAGFFFFFFSLSTQSLHRFTSVNQVDFCERIVCGGQDLFWAFLPKWNTQQIRE